MAKSFYDFDDLIELNNKRIDEFNTNLNRIQDKYSVPLIIYSGIAIYLVQVVQHGIRHDFEGYTYTIFLLVFAVLFSLSLFFFVRLLAWIDRLYVQKPAVFYDDVRSQYEQTHPLPAGKATVDELLKASYIDDQEAVLDRTIEQFARKQTFYNRALAFGLLSLVPFLVCLVFHFSKTPEDKPTRVEIVKSSLSLPSQINRHVTDSVKYDQNRNQRK